MAAELYPTSDPGAANRLGLIAEGTTRKVGQPFFDSLVHCLAEVLRADFAMVARLTDGSPGRAHTLAYWANGGLARSFAYDLKGTPCEQVLGRRVCSYPEGVQKSFPDDAILRDLQIEAYVGIPLVDSQGNSLGLMSALFLRKLNDLENEVADVQNTLRIFAARATAELERLQSEHQLRITQFMVDSAHLPVYRIDTGGCIRYANRSACVSLGYTEEELLGLSIWQIDPSVSAVGWQSMLHDLQELGIHELESIHERKDGSRFPVRVQASLMEYEGESYLAAFVHDLTRRKELEHLLDQSRRMESLGRLAGGIAHDFNNLLTAIIGYGELARQQARPGSSMRKRLDKLCMAAGSGARLTSQLLAFSRKRVLRSDTVDLNQLLSDTMDLLQPLLGEGLELVLDLAGDLGYVRGEAGQIEQVLVNLALNSRDAMPDGGTLRMATYNQSGDQAERQAAPHVVIEVSDDGDGIAPEHIPRIFEPFYTTKDQGHGTGLGLATCYAVMQQHRGRVELSSQLGRGTTVRLLFPRTDARLEAVVAPTNNATAAGNETILIVEDLEMLRTLAETQLSKLGYRVLTAVDGVEALELSRSYEGPIALLMTDVVMPRMGGCALSACMLEERPQLKVLYCSGYTRDAIVENGVLDPEAAFIQKPFTLKTLAARIRALLDKSGGLLELPHA